MAVETLAARIARRIDREGPLSIAAFMAMALHDRDAGYYARRRPLGAGGDFITAPEISQIFGELIGLWFADLWQRMERPDPVILAELGPGSGALMQDLLRAAALVPEFPRAASLWLVEASPLLRAEQQQRLGVAEPHFIDGIDELPAGPLLLVGNEFLDALPIRQLVQSEAGWRERLVGTDAAGELVLVLGPADSALALLVPPALRAAPLETVVEVCPAAATLATALGARLARQPGAALFVDYGHCASRPGATLAAIRGHRPAAILDDPGSADLSAHVDFAAFAAAAENAGAIVYGPLPQGRFLTSLGAEARLNALLTRATAAQRIALQTGLRRLIDPAEMGNLFKAVALISPGLPVPAGFTGDAADRG